MNATSQEAAQRRGHQRGAGAAEAGRIRRKSAHPAASGSRGNGSASWIWRCLIIGWGCWLALTPAAARGEEPALAFLTALREQGHFDLALTYLDQMEESRLAPESFRRRIPLYRAETVIESVNQLRDIGQWESRLTDAQKLLEDFSATAASADDRSLAAETLANLRFRQGRFYLHKAETPRLSDSEREELRNKARASLNGSIEAFESARVLTRDRLEQIKQAAGSAAVDPEVVKQLRTSFTQIRLRKPIATELLADTWPAGSAEQIDLLTRAEAEYLDVWKDYRNYRAGVDGCLFAARCRQKLGKPVESVQLLDELLTMNDRPELLPIKQQAGLMAIDAWRAMEPYPYEQVIQRLQPLIANLTRAESRKPEWLKLQLEVARGLRAKAESMEAAGGSAGDIRELNKTAAVLAKNVARVPGTEQAAARELLQAWNIDLASDADTGEAPPASFLDARTRAADLIADLDLQKTELKELRTRLDAASDAERPVLQAEWTEAEKQMAAVANQAMDLLRDSARLVTPDTPRADRNHVRYLQAVVLYSTGRYLEAALLGEFLVRHWPTEEWTRQSAVIAINAWASLFEAAPADQRAFELQRLSEFCQVVEQRWSGSPEASHAAGILAKLALSANDSERARELVERMGSGGRGQMAIKLQLAQRIWNEILQGRAGLEGEALQAQLAASAPRIAEARKLLEEGLAEVTPENIDFAAARGRLLLARMLLESGEPALAVDQLELSGSGPLDLIKQGHPAVTSGPNADVLQRETFRTAITAYLGCLRGGSDPGQWIGRAEGVLKALRDQLRTLPEADAARELSAVYSVIAAELKAQIRSIPDPEEGKRLAQNLAKFLYSLAETTTEGKTGLWAASTLMEVVLTLEQKIRPEARADLVPLYRTAVQILELVRSKGFGADPQAEALELETGRYLGLAHRGIGNWDEATRAFASVLEKRATLIRTQIDAAETLQMQGRQSGVSAPLGKALMGTEPREDPKTKRKENVIWGWRRLVLVTKGREDFAESHRRALYGLIESQLEYGVLEKSDKAIRSALTQLETWRKAEPEYGSAEWKKKAGELELRIQQQLKSGQ